MKLWIHASAEARSGFFALLAIYWISETILLQRMRAGVQDRDEDRGSSGWLAILFPLGWLSAVVLTGLRQFSFGSSSVFAAGLCAMAAGQLLRWWSIATLGRLFTVNVAIREGHRLVTHGPYRWVRHPSYTAVLLFHVGAAACLGNVLSVIALVACSTAGLLIRMRVEEDALLRGLGAEYAAYLQRTKRLIPGVY